VNANALDVAADTPGDVVEFPTPVNILRQLATEPFTIGDVPDTLADYPTTWAMAGGIDTSLPILSAICAVAAVLDDRIRVEVDANREWYESPRCWAFVVAAPGAGKSPAEKAMLSPVIELHREEHESWDALTKQEPEVKHPQPRLFVSDVTIEKLTDVLIENEGGVLIWNDELGSLIGSHDQYRSSGGGRDRYEYMRLFDGGPHQVERVQRGSMFIPNWGASTLSATTPAALGKLSKKLDEDGLLQRFIVAVAGPRTAPIRTIDPKDDRATYRAMLRRLRSYKQHSGNITVQFMPEAADVFYQFEREATEMTEAAYSLMPSLGSHLAKHAAIVARLTLIFHAVQCQSHPSTEKVSKETVGLAIRFMRKARRHAMAVYSALTNNTGPLDIARDVARWLLSDTKRGVATVERRNIVQYVASFRRESPDTRAQAMTLLVDYGWLVADTGKYDKGHPTHWHLNPALREVFATEAAYEQRMRKARLELLKERTDIKC
jgi:Protein of unknown function (DUF3987)